MEGENRPHKARRRGSRDAAAIMVDVPLKGLRLCSDGDVSSLTIAAGESLTARLEKILKAEPVLLGRLEDKGVSIFCTNNQHKKNLDVNPHYLPPPLEDVAIKGDLILIRSDLVTAFTAEDYEELALEALARLQQEEKVEGGGGGGGGGDRDEDEKDADEGESEEEEAEEEIEEEQIQPQGGDNDRVIRDILSKEYLDSLSSPEDRSEFAIARAQGLSRYSILAPQLQSTVSPSDNLPPAQNLEEWRDRWQFLQHLSIRARNTSIAYIVLEVTKECTQALERKLDRTEYEFAVNVIVVVKEYFSQLEDESAGQYLRPQTLQELTKLVTDYYVDHSPVRELSTAQQVIIEKTVLNFLLSFESFCSESKEPESGLSSGFSQFLLERLLLKFGRDEGRSPTPIELQKLSDISRRFAISFQAENSAQNESPEAEVSL